MTDFDVSTTTGMVLNVSAQRLGSELAVDTPAGATTLLVASSADFDETGGLLRIGGDDPDAEILRYEYVTDPDDDDDLDDEEDWYEGAEGIRAGFGGAEEWDTRQVDPVLVVFSDDDGGPADEYDEDADIYVGPGTITLAEGVSLAHAWEEGTRVDMWDLGMAAPSTQWRALVRPTGDQDATDSIDAVLAFPVVPLLPEGVRGEDEARELVVLDGSTGEWTVVNVVGRVPAVQGQMLSPGSVLPDALGFTVGSTQVTISGTPPEDPHGGDIWFDPARGYQMMEWNEATETWVPRQYGNDALATGAASRVFLQSATPPDPREGDLWIYVDINGGMQPFRWDPTIVIEPDDDLPAPPPGDWVPVVFNTEAIAAGQIAAGFIDVGVLQAVSIIAGSFTAGVVGGTDVRTHIVNAHMERGSSFHLNGDGGNLLAYSEPTGAIDQTFTASGTWLVPPDVTSVRVECWGAGGGGGYRNGTTNGGGGGGGGEYARNDTLPVVPGSTCTITVGTGGAGGTTPTNAGNGGYTRFTNAAGQSVTANGGTNGRWSAPGRRGLGGTGSTAPVRYNGGNGVASTGLTYKTRGGGGGSSAGTGRPGNHATGYGGAGAPPGGGLGGNGGAPGVSGGTTNGLAGHPPGGGGGGCSTTGTSGGAGYRGEIHIRYTPGTGTPPQLMASLAGVAGTDDHTGVPIAYPRGLRVQRPELAGFLGGYYQRVLPALNQVITSTPVVTTPLTGLRNAQLISDYGNAWDYSTGTWTCPAVGLYEFDVGIVFQYGVWVNNSAIAIFIIPGGGDRTAAFATFQGTVYDSHANLHGTRWCVLGETVRVNVRQNTGVSQTIEGNANGSYIAIRRVI